MYLQSRFGRPQGKGTFGTDHPHIDREIFVLKIIRALKFPGAKFS